MDIPKLPDSSNVPSSKNIFWRLKQKFKGFSSNYRSLPIGTKRLLSLGIVIALLIALPIIVFTIINSRTYYFNRAASGEASGEPPLASATPINGRIIPIYINESFTGSGPIDLSKMTWVGSGSRSSVSLQRNTLNVYVPSGKTKNSGNHIIVTLLLDRLIPIIKGDFDVSVDLLSITSNTGWQGLKFAPKSSITIKRVKNLELETLEVWTSELNDGNETKVASVNLTGKEGSIKVRMVRSGNTITVHRAYNNAFILMATINMNGLQGEGALPRLIVQNSPPTYPSVVAYFDNYQATINSTGTSQSATPTPTPSPTPTPTPTVNPTPTTNPTPTPSGTPSVRTFNIHLKLKGVENDGANLAKVTVRFVSSLLNYPMGLVTSELPIEHEGNGIYTLTFSVPANSLPSGNNYSIILKGEKHVAAKYCQASSQKEHCSGNGQIAIPENTQQVVNLDFSQLPLEPGDVYPQNGIANGDDFNKIITLLTKVCSDLTDQDKLVGDLDYNGCVNIKDAFLMRQTLETRYDEY